MGKVLGVAIAIITLVATAVFLAHVWWMPANISTHGPGVDEQINSTMIEAGISFVLSQLLLAYMVWRYKDRGERKVSFLPGGAKGTVTTAFLLVGLELIGLELVGTKVWAEVYFKPAPPSAVRVHVSAEQFGFYFQYPGPDGKFGNIHPDKIDPGTGNFFGLDPEHEVEARDDVIVGSLAVPVNKPVELILHSKDVNHSFYVPELRIQQDIVPGLEIPIHFTATKVGRYDIVCTQLCGLGHYKMRGDLQVMSQEDYDKWLKEQSGQ